MPKIEIYTKLTCDFCVRAKRLPGLKNAPFEEFSVDLGGAKEAEMVERAGGGSTVPQIFINGRHVGGCNDLMALEGQRKLDELLAA